jgi:hypothetical protein
MPQKTEIFSKHAFVKRERSFHTTADKVYTWPQLGVKGRSFGAENGLKNPIRKRYCVTNYNFLYYSDSGAPLLEHYKQYRSTAFLNNQNFS